MAVLKDIELWLHHAKRHPSGRSVSWMLIVALNVTYRLSPISCSWKNAFACSIVSSSSNFFVSNLISSLFKYFMQSYHGHTRLIGCLSFVVDYKRLLLIINRFINLKA